MKKLVIPPRRMAARIIWLAQIKAAKAAAALHRKKQRAARAIAARQAETAEQ